jgi:hypothetical protein
MIRPVPYVDLPGIVRALDDRARARNGEFADFVVAPDIEEPRSGLAALLSAILPITPDALTWICEDHWRLLGLAQARKRPGAQAWDLNYLAAMTPSGGQEPIARSDDVLRELLQFALDAAIRSGVQRFFARVEEGRPELMLFSKLGFQRYACELAYWLTSAPDGLAALGSAEPRDGGGARRFPRALFARLTGEESLLASQAEIEPEVPLRAWHRHDGWALLRLYDASTPKRVQLAEGLSSEELVATRAAGGRTWRVPLLEPAAPAYVHDRGARLGGWMRLRYGRGNLPHVISLMAHPDDDGVALALLRSGLRVLAHESPRPILCQVRDYDTHVIDALRTASFEHTTTHALLIRHMTARALWRRDVAVAEPRVLYGVKGLGTASSRLSEGEKTYYAREKH